MFRAHLATTVEFSGHHVVAFVFKHKNQKVVNKTVHTNY